MSFKQLTMQDIYDRVDSLSARERIIILVTLVVALLMVWDSWFLQDMMSSRRNLNERIALLESSVKTSETIVKQMQSKVDLDPNVMERQRLARYQSEVERIDEVLKAKTLEFISPQQMVEVLRNLIDEQPGMRLVHLQSTKPQVPLLDSEKDLNTEEITDSANKAEQDFEMDTPTVYLHGLEMNFKGDFFSVLNYVKKLESLKWRFAWESLDISLEKYPMTNVYIRLETLSLTEGWIGV